MDLWWWIGFHWDGLTVTSSLQLNEFSSKRRAGRTEHAQAGTCLAFINNIYIYTHIYIYLCIYSIRFILLVFSLIPGPVA